VSPRSDTDVAGIAHQHHRMLPAVTSNLPTLACSSLHGRGQVMVTTV